MDFEMVFAAALLTDDILGAIHDLHAYSNGGGTSISRDKVRSIVDKYVMFDDEDFRIGERRWTGMLLWRIGAKRS